MRRFLVMMALLLALSPLALWAQSVADNPAPPIRFTLDGELTIGERRVLSISGVDPPLQALAQSLEFSWGRVKPALCRPDYGATGAVSLSDAQSLSAATGSPPNIGISYQDRALVCYVARLRYMGVPSGNDRVDKDSLVGVALLWRSAAATEEVASGGGISFGERFRQAFVGRLGPTVTILIFTPFIAAFFQLKVKKPALSLGSAAVWLSLGTFFFGASGWLLFLILPLCVLTILAWRFSR